MHAWKGDRREGPLTVPLIHHSLDDHWKRAPVQVKVQLRRKEVTTVRLSWRERVG